MNKFKYKKTYFYIDIEKIGYKVDPSLSLDSFEIIERLFEEKAESKFILSTVINMQIQSDHIPTVELISEQDESFFEQVISGFLSVDDTLQTEYMSNYVIEDLSERFIVSCQKYLVTIASEFSQRVTTASKMLSATLSDLCSSMGEMLSATSQAMKNIIKSISTQLNEAYKIIGSHEIDEEQLRESFRTWGEYGWTIIPDAPINFFNECPVTKREADKKAGQYCKQNNLKVLFEELRNKQIHKKNLEESIYCFQHKKYKACALVLLGMIDAKLIRMQPKKKGRRRPYGAKAMNVYIQTNDISNTFFTFLYFENLVSYLNTLFKDGKDFENEPEVCNRNFLGHGMSNRYARRRDCIQLFLALNSLFDLLDLYK